MRPTILLALACVVACGGDPQQPVDASAAIDAQVDAARPIDAAPVDMVAMTVDGTPISFQGNQVKFYFSQAGSRFTLEATEESGAMVKALFILLPDDITATTNITACSSLDDKEMDWYVLPPGTQYSAGGRPGTSCAIQLTAFGPVGSVVSGTFKGVLEKDSVLVSLNNGTFSVKRGLDH